MEFGIKAEETNLALQRSLAIPDLTLGGSWDPAGNYVNNYYGFTVSMSIPTFDRNQGNIRESELILASKKAKYEEKNQDQSRSPFRRRKSQRKGKITFGI
ncbi:TolC family protein [Leptospira alexanderi]|uniref:TolC family protein n=1 Tax=Leptospira alexanderi TaxID=100053 RepID=UPI001FCAE1C5|nr:TolC family protein [Leptospira alexanderi]